MKKLLLFFVTMLLPLVASADAVEIGGIYYNLVPKAKQAEVTSKPSGYYTGAITIPESFIYDGITYNVKSIGEKAFYNCSGLTSITIPNSVTSIGSYAFRGCSSLTSITIPNSLTSIGASAFNGCSSLASVTIPNSVISIGDYAFWECSSLASVNIGNSVMSIGEYAFYNCHKLKSITIPNSVTSIGIGAFDRCSGLTSVTIGNSVTGIGDRAFYSCNGLTSITIPNSVTSIDERAFSGCNGLTSVIIGNGVISIGGYAFEECTRLQKVIVPDIASWCRITFAYPDSNPLYYAHHLFSDFETEITELVIPNSVTSIGSDAFYGCSGLTTVTIPNSVTDIGGWAFRECSGLTSITIPNSVTGIGSSAFNGCSKIASISIGSGISTIKSKAFANCTDLTDVYCNAESVPTTNSDAFENSYIDYATLHVPTSSVDTYKAEEPWSGFKEVVAIEEELPESVTAEIGGIYYNLKPKEKLAEVTSNPSKYSGAVTIPESVTYKGVTCNVTSIGENAFKNCSGLTSVTIPNSVTSIGSYAFYNCSVLNSIDIPNSVTTIEEGAFEYCTGLNSVVIPSSVKSIGGWVFQYCSGLTSVTIPNSVTSISECTFYDCSDLTSITIPNSVTSIGSGAFDGCSSLTSITIPNSVTSIAYTAFHGCSSLITVTVEIETPLSIYEYTFTNRANATLYVPKGCKAAYETADYWKEFKEIKETEPAETKCATPTISFVGGKLQFECETEGVTYHYSVTTPVIEDGTNNNVDLPSSYTVRVYATKDGLTDSDVATKEIDIRGKKGDVNEDGQVTITDAVGVVDIILNAKE